jgi:hypothetical protein
MTKREQLQRRNEFIEQFLNHNVYPSWTWERLTGLEQMAFEDLIADFPLAGTDEKKWDILNHAYHAFLKGTGYKAIGWRE